LDKKAFDEIQDRILEVNKVVSKIDPSIRVAAFDFLKSYISSGNLVTPAVPNRPAADEHSGNDEAALIQKHGDGKPHENVNLLAAMWFMEFGSHPFSLDYVRAKAISTGLTIPERPSMTLVQAKEKGKKLYGPSGRGNFKPTVVGEAFFKATYQVKKGTKTPPSDK
jgi:hypothetical protein